MKKRVTKVTLGVLGVCLCVIMSGVFGGVNVRAAQIPYLEYGLNSIYFLDPCETIIKNNGGKLSSNFNPNEVFNENATKIMTALLEAGYSPVEVAGIMGSLKGESGAFNPGEGENAYMGDVSEENRNFRVTDSPCYNRCGFGIAQWTSGVRQNKLQAYADSQNLAVSSLEAQTGYLIKELKEYGFAPGSFKFGAKGDDAEAAAKAAVEVCTNYEIPGFSPAEARATCISRGSEAYGRAAYELMQTGGSGVSSSGSSHTSGGFSTVQASDDGSNVTIIGDSITEGAKLELLDVLPEADIHSQSSKQFSTGGSDNPSGLAILEDLVNNSSLRRVLVFALGTNGTGSASEENIKKVLDLAGEGTQVVFVTNFTTASDYNFNNNNFMKAANDYDNVSVVDWKGAISENPEKYLVSDGIHPNSEGRKIFAALIKDEVSGSFSAGVKEDDTSAFCRRLNGEDDENQDDGCGGGAAISRVAKQLAWPDKNHYNQINPDYAKAAGEVGLAGYGVNLGDAQDCGKFVAVVVRKAVDPDFPPCCTWEMERYMSNSANWKEIPNESSESNMKPGDIMVVNEGSHGYGSKETPSGGQGGAGHVQIYIGGDEKLASASLSRRTGNLGEYFAFSSRGWNYRIFRFVGSTANDEGCGDESLGNLGADLEKIEESTGHKVGVAVAAYGSSEVSTSGSWEGGKAWATINVPLAIAAIDGGDAGIGSVTDPYGKQCDYSDDMGRATKAAVGKSNNYAAWWLWESLGGDNQGAAGKVNDALRAGGDGATSVASNGTGASLTAAKTTWLLKDQALFAANLGSVKGAGSIMKDMNAQNGADGNAGLNVFDKAISKGGWGSGSGAATRQFGIIKLSSGQCTAVAIGADYYDSSFDVLTKIAQALKDNESELPSGQCPNGL